LPLTWQWYRQAVTARFIEDGGLSAVVAQVTATVVTFYAYTKERW